VAREIQQEGAPNVLPQASPDATLFWLAEAQLRCDTHALRDVAWMSGRDAAL
jgi:hypothetical protein